MAKLSDAAMDTGLLKGGVWWDWSTQATCPGNEPHEENGCFLIVPTIASRFEAVLADEVAPYAEVFRRKPPDAEKDEHQAVVDREFYKCRARAMARTILRGWANWDELEDWTEDKAAAFLSDTRYMLFADFIARCSRNNEAALAREEEQAKGN